MSEREIDKVHASESKNSQVSDAAAKPRNIRISLELLREKRDPINIEIDEPIILGEGIWGLFGNSGTGKSTLLKALAGLYKNAQYAFSIHQASSPNNAEVSHYNNLPASHNPCVYLGSDSMLFDHLSVYENLRLVQKHGGFSASAQINYQQAVDLCGIQDLLKQTPRALSSGETQRVKFARALLSGKPCILLDEAFSALDWPTRQYFSSLVVSLHQQYGLSFVIVSHSLRELALSCTHISKLVEGKIIQSGPASQMIEALQLNSTVNDNATEKFAEQKEVYTGDVFSLLKVKVISNDEHARLAECALLSDNQSRLVLVRANTPLAIDQEYKLTLDADKVSLSTRLVQGTSMLNSLCGEVVEIKHYNSVVLVSLMVASQKLHAAISIRSFEDLSIKIGDELFALFKAL
jgi:molybdate transport system ATP-binding protein